MFAGGLPGDDRTVTSDSLSSVQHLIDLIEQGAPQEQITEAEQELNDSLKSGDYRVKDQLPSFQKTVRNLDAAQAFQQFRLPGKDIVVEDKREQFLGKPADEASKQTVSESMKRGAREDVEKQAAERKEASHKEREELRLREGKLVREKDKDLRSRLGERTIGRGELDRQVAGERVDRLLSAFERLVIERFENGRSVERLLTEGKQRFLEKTEAQWRDFFKALAHREVEKKVLISEIRDFLMRGIIPRGAKGICIGDVRFESGRIEKFVRFSVFAEALAKLKKLSPGDVIGKEALGEFTGEELMYLALAAARARALQMAEKATQGKFVDGRAEALAANALGIPIDQHLRQKAKKLRRHSGLLGGDLLGEDVPGETPYQFIPWWNWGNLKRPGKLRWVTAVFYGTLLVLSLIGLATITWRLLGGS